MNNNTIESIEWHKEQLAKLLSDEIGFYKVESELDSILEKAKMKKKVLVRRGGKTFYREQEVGTDETDKKDKTKKDKASKERERIGGVKFALKHSGWRKDEIDASMPEIKAGKYDHLLGEIKK